MDNTQSPSSNTSKRRVRIYERLGRSTSASAPGMTFGMGVGILAILIVLIIVLSRYW
jgi:hypothetical protein